MGESLFEYERKSIGRSSRGHREGIVCIDGKEGNCWVRESVSGNGTERISENQNIGGKTIRISGKTPQIATKARKR